MKLEAFLLIFLCILVDSSFAAGCPVRAIFAPTPEIDGGYGCVCRKSFYGNKCQFQGEAFSKCPFQIQVNYLIAVLSI
jgi:hypothetical protein